MIEDISYAVALAASVIWFLMGARYFGFQHHTAAKILVAPSARNTPIFETVAAGIRFLGGMNAAFALLSGLLLVLLLTESTLFTNPAERAVLLATLATAHLSQFLGNVPVLRNGERQGEAYWPVLSGPMLMIFMVDFLQALLSGGVALLILVV